jgi:MoxR-like ATPase
MELSAATSGDPGASRQGRRCDRGPDLFRKISAGAAAARRDPTKHASGAADEFEAFLLELLSDFQVSIPELGTIAATTIPHVVLTSNGTRELSDALRRRCLYHYVDYPDIDREARIIMVRIDGASASLSLQIARMVAGIRKEELRKAPGVGETLDWAAALVGLDVRDLHDEPETVHETLMCLLKTQEDKARVTREVAGRILGKVA